MPVLSFHIILKQGKFGLRAIWTFLQECENPECKKKKEQDDGNTDASSSPN